MKFKKCATCGKNFSGVCFSKGHQIEEDKKLFYPDIKKAVFPMRAEKVLKKLKRKEKSK